MLNLMCNFCKDNSQEDKCIEIALDSIRTHFSTYKKLLSAKQEEINVLQEHNERLTQAVEFLKVKPQTTVEQPATRRNRSDEGVERELLNISTLRHFDSEPNAIKAMITESSGDEMEDLNRALNSPELSSTSPNECVIAETEIFKSPIKIPKRLLKKAEGEWRCKENEYKRKLDGSKRLRQSRLKFDKKKNEILINKSSKTDSPLNRPKVSKTSSSIVQSLLSNNQQINWEEDEDDFEDLVALPAKYSKKACLSLTKKITENTDFIDTSIDNKIMTPSIIVVSPPPPEIVCLDESTNEADITQINTMELLEADASTLERAEKKLIENAKRINQEHMIKSEPKTQKIMSDESEDDIFEHRPIIIKKEQESPANLQKQTNPNNIMESMQETPDGFWNPFLISFDENDPRKEVLKDTRLNKRN